MALDSSSFVRKTVAERQDLPEALVAKLAFDWSVDVRLAIAERPDLPASLIERMVGDVHSCEPGLHWRVRRAIARRADLPPAVIEQLATDDDEWVRKSIGERRALSPQAASENEPEALPAPGM
jgi:hypothetical protein